MQLSNEAITSFQKIYKKKCGVELEYEEAHSKALEELQRFSLIYQQIPIQDKDYFDQIKSNK